jgi:glycosyltransferase involved in cell wall biosynthesis
MNDILTVALLAQLLPGRAGGIERNLLDLLAHLHEGNHPVRAMLIGPGDASGWLRKHAGPDGEVLAWPPVVYHPGVSLLAARAGPLHRKVLARLARWWISGSGYLASRGHHVAMGKRLSAQLRSRGVQVVHFAYQRYFETDLPFVFEPWDLQHRHYPQYFSAAELRLRDSLYREACERASLVVVPTHWGKKDLLAWLAIDPRKIAVIGRGAGAIERPPSGMPVKTNAGRYILYPAKFWPHKNHATLFEALNILRRQGHDVRLVCTGDPAEALPAPLRKLIARIGIEQSVSFLGHVERSELVVLLANAEMLVFPSLFEGYGIPVLEAMALQVPVVCSSIGPLVEVAGGAAEPFDPASADDMAAAIGRVWVDDARREELRQQGRQRARAFDWHRTAADFVICYKKVAGVRLESAELKRFRDLTQEGDPSG